MGKPKRAGRTAVLEVEASKPVEKSASAAVTAEAPGLWAIAMLRIAVELKRPNAPGLDEIIEGIAARMGIPQDEFRRYLDANVGLLKATARKRGYAP